MARPRLPESEQHLNRISVLLNDNDDVLLRSIAKKKGIPTAVLARTILLSKLDSLTMIGNSLSKTQSL